MSTFSMSTASEAEAEESLSRDHYYYGAPPSDASSSATSGLHRVDDFFPKRVNFKMFHSSDDGPMTPVATADTTRSRTATQTTGPGLGPRTGSGSTPPLPNPFAHEAQQHELHGMFAREEYAPTSAGALLTLLGLAVGVGLGALLSQLDASAALVAWLQFPGELYLGALLCVIVPATFCSVVVAVAEAVANATARRVAVVASLWFMLSVLLAAAVGTLFAAVFASTFAPTHFVPAPATLPQLAFQCASGQWLTARADDAAVVCAASAPTSVSDIPSRNASALFTVHETDAFFVRSTSAFATASVTDQIVGVLSNMIPTNVLAGFVDGTAVSVVFTAFFFAVACAYGHDSRHGVPNYLLLLLTQALVVLRKMTNVLLKLMPVAAVFVVAGAVAANDSSIGVVYDVVYLVLALLAAACVFLLVVMGALLYVTTGRRSVRDVLRHVVPAQAFALGAASTLATLPMTVRCVDATGDVPRATARIVLALGATCNFTGMSLYTPLAVVFLAKISGLEATLTPAKYVLLWALSALAGVGAKSVESAETVMVLTVWRAVLGTEPSEVVATLVVADWLLARVRTVVNVTCHAMLARIVAEQCRSATSGRHRHQKEPSEFLGDDEFGTMTPMHFARTPTSRPF